MVYLLDTNILSAIMRERDRLAASRLERVAMSEDDRVVTSIVVASELKFGAEKQGSAQLRMRVEKILESIVVEPLSKYVDDHYAIVRADLERRGTVIGANDLLIAAHALAINAVLVTDNVGEFERVKGLRVENWLRG
jgi:tRNA(fMet)-specific endonuclease VapC